MFPQRRHQQILLRLRVALLHDVAQIRPVKAGDVLVRIAQLQLVNDVVAHPPRGAGGERRDRALGKMKPQPAQLPVVGPEFVSPLRDAVRLINRKKRNRHLLEPRERVLARQPLRRHVQQPVLSVTRLADHIGLLRFRQRAVQQRRRNSHLRQLRRLILHQRDQRRNHDHGFSRQHRRRQLVAQRLPAAGRHHYAGVAASEQASHDSLLQRAKRVISPVAAQRREQIPLRRSFKEYRPLADKFLLVPAIRNLASRTSHSSFGSRSIASNAYPWLELAATSAQFNS